MREKRKRWGLLLALSLALTACGGGTEDEAALEGAAESAFDKNVIYRESDIRFGSDDHVTNIALAGDTLYVEEIEFVLAQEGVQESYSSRTFTAYDLEGNQKSQFSVRMNGDDSPGLMTADDEGNIYAITLAYLSDESDENGENSESGGEWRMECILHGYSPQGEELFQARLSGGDSEEYSYVNSLYAMDDGRLLLHTGQGIQAFNPDTGELSMLLARAEDGERTLVRVRDSGFGVVTTKEGESVYQGLDITTGRLGEDVALPFIFYTYGAYDGKGWDMYLTDDNKIYGYNIGDAEPTPLMDLMASDFAGLGVASLEAADEERLLIQYYGADAAKVALFTKIPPQEVAEKTELVLGCHYLEYVVKMKVVDFNKKSDKYRITIRDYSSYDTAAEGEGDGYLTRMNTDIASGNIPDIVLLSPEMPLESYFSKGIFTDFYELMENDPEIGRKDFLPNILSALEYNGGLYQMIPEFYINTYIGKTADVGEGYSWDFQEAMALLESKPEGTKLFADMLRSAFLEECLSYGDQELIDWEKGECYFDSDAFIRLLEYAKTLPKDYAELESGGMDFEEAQLQYREGKTLLASAAIMRFYDYGSYRYAHFGEEISLIGFPVENGNGSSFNYSINFGIAGQSANKEAAWEFVRGFLTQEYQDEVSYYFPVRKSSLEKLAQRAQEKPYYLDGDGNKVEYEDFYYLAGQEIAADPLTQEEAGQLLEFIRSIDKLTVYDSALYKIIQEEADGFLEGQKSAQEVAGIIQSRAGIYLRE